MRLLETAKRSARGRQTPCKHITSCSLFTEELNLFVSTYLFVFMETQLYMLMCAGCDRKITPDLIGTYGKDHHDPDEMRCVDCLNGLIARAENMAEMSREDAWAMVSERN